MRIFNPVPGLAASNWRESARILARIAPARRLDDQRPNPLAASSLSAAFRSARFGFETVAGELVAVDEQGSLESVGDELRLRLGCSAISSPLVTPAADWRSVRTSIGLRSRRPPAQPRPKSAAEATARPRRSAGGSAARSEAALQTVEDVTPDLHRLVERVRPVGKDIIGMVVRRMAYRRENFSQPAPVRDRCEPASIRIGPESVPANRRR